MSGGMSKAGMAVALAALGMSGGGVIPEMPTQRRRRYRKPEGRDYTKDGPLVTPSCDVSQHNTLRHDQVERRRKVRRKANRAAHRRYRRARE